jgi:hypothetical protein
MAVITVNGLSPLLSTVTKNFSLGGTIMHVSTNIWIHMHLSFSLLCNLSKHVTRKSLCNGDFISAGHSGIAVSKCYAFFLTKEKKS